MDEPRNKPVLLDGSQSDTVSVTSGVPQGTVLGPLLFLLYINDLQHNITSSMRLFADDCVIYKTIANLSDHDALQNDLNVVLGWCETWDMKLNADKCMYMKVSRLKLGTFSRYYRLGSHLLSPVDTYKYLGLFMNCDLKWNEHIQQISQKANQML